MGMRSFGLVTASLQLRPAIPSPATMSIRLLAAQASPRHHHSKTVPSHFAACLIAP
jgi:hypothetical protein